MKMSKILQGVLISAVLLMSGNALAFRGGGPIQDHCRDPKFKGFSLTEFKAPEKAEVAPESEFSFTLSGWTDPEKIKLTVKDKVLPIEILFKKSFYLIKSKIPAEYTGKFVRINAFATATMGCRSKDGWLVKVASGPAAAEAAPAEAEAAVEVKAPESALPADK